MWDLWWTKYHWDRFFSKFFSFPVYIIPSGLQTHIYNLGMNNMPAGGHSSDINVSLKVEE
jgi:hypothetical protein